MKELQSVLKESDIQGFLVVGDIGGEGRGVEGSGGGGTRLSFKPNIVLDMAKKLTLP